MTHDNNPAPLLYRGVMVSSTFNDLKAHREALIKAINGAGLSDVAMENDTAKPVGIIESSLQMVREAAACIVAISLKYGQILPSKLNPDELSVTELEFNEAQRLGRPILLFVMDEGHLVLKADVETDTGKVKKLDAFRERAKQHGVHDTFKSLEDFAVKATQAAANLRRHLEAQTPAPTEKKLEDPIPTPPDFYAEPPYIGSHNFFGRQAELDRLNDWAVPADPHPVLLFEAIGGNGKSMLTWHWTTQHSTAIRKDWAGRFWYSFYERGAIMADFCQRALAYMTGQPLADFRKMKTPELTERLLHQLRDRPWLLILDGLERVLVAYHRYDAAQLPDEDANQPTDQIAHRDPCSAIRPEDDDLLRLLAAAAPSKLLITSRLIPRVLLNPAGQPIPGVSRITLPGLRPPDAEALLRSCGVTGASQAIQDYLKSNCDCHPLVTGILGGLITNYLPARGNFDAWAADPKGGGQLNLANLELVQKRNHILKAALDDLPEKSRELLSTLAFVSEAVDYATLRALCSHTESVPDLERRGLLQYDCQTGRYDMHPVVRGIAAGGLRQDETEAYGQRVVDYFSAQADGPYDQCESIADVRNGLLVIRTLLKMGRYRQASEVYCGDLSDALHFNLEANVEILSLLKPFFPLGWNTLPIRVEETDGAYLANAAGFALERVDEFKDSLAASGAALLAYLRQPNWILVGVSLCNISRTLRSQNRLAQETNCLLLNLRLASLSGYKQTIFRARQYRFQFLSTIGQWTEARTIWGLLDPMGRDWPRGGYRPGSAEYAYAQFCFWQGGLEEGHLRNAEQLAAAGRNRFVVRQLYSLRGQWRLEQGQWALAAESLREAVRMAREVGRIAENSEPRLALAKFHIGQLADPRAEAEQLASARWVGERCLAELWLAIGDHEQAKKHALAAYEWAWADGEPYVHRYELTKARDLLEKLGAPIPDLPPFDPAKYEKLPWEDEVAAAIEKLCAEKQS